MVVPFYYGQKRYFNFCDLSRFALWPLAFGIFKRKCCALRMCILQVTMWNVLQMSVQSISNVSCFSCLACVDESGVLKFLTTSSACFLIFGAPTSRINICNHLLFNIYFILYFCVCMGICVCHSTCAEVNRQPAGVDSLLHHVGPWD